MPLLLLGLGLVVVIAITGRRRVSGADSEPPVPSPPPDPPPSLPPPIVLPIDPACDAANNTLPGNLARKDDWRTSMSPAQMISAAMMMEKEAGPTAIGAYDDKTRAALLVMSACLRKEAAAKGT